MKRKDKNIIIPYIMHTLMTIIILLISFTDFVKLGDEFRIGMISSWLIYSVSVEFFNKDKREINDDR